MIKRAFTDLQHCRDCIANDIGEVIRPELQRYELGGPYILLASSSGIEVPDHLFGITHPETAVTYQDRISDFRGNGPAWVINDGAIHRFWGSVELSVEPFVAVCAHELSHCLEVPGLCHDVQPKWWREPVLNAEIAEPRAADSDIRQKRFHQPTFIRLALHVRYRMQRRGWRIWLEDLLNWERDTTETPGAHLDALRPELETLAHVPLSEITSTPAPEAFSALFESETSEADCCASHI